MDPDPGILWIRIRYIVADKGWKRKCIILTLNIRTDMRMGAAMLKLVYFSFTRTTRLELFRKFLSCLTLHVTSLSIRPMGEKIVLCSGPPEKKGLTGGYKEMADQ
jgi:hypothetical protein